MKSSIIISLDDLMKIHNLCDKFADENDEKYLYIYL